MNQIAQAEDSVHLAITSQSMADHRLVDFNSMLDICALYEVVSNDKGQPIDSRILEVNRAFEHMVASSRDKLIGLKASDIFGNIPDWVQERCYRVAETGKSDQFEFQYTPGDAYYHISVFSAEKGKFMSVSHDITAHRRAEEALRESREKYQLLFENAHDAIFVVQDGFIKFNNQKICEITGFSQEILKGIQFAGLIHHLDRQMVPDNHGSDNSDKRIDRAVECRIIDSEGKIKWLETNSITIDWEGRAALLIFANDVTERKSAEDALRSSEKRFRIAAELASDIIYEWNLLVNYYEYYGDIDKTLGYEKNEFPRSLEAWGKIIHPDDFNRVIGSLEAHFKTGKPFDEAYRIIRKDGKIAYLADRGMAVFDENGKPYKWVGVISDITGRKQDEARQAARAEYLSKLVGLTDCHEIAELTYKHIRSLLPCDAGALMLLHKESEQDKFEVVYNFDTEEGGAFQAKSEREFFDFQPDSISAHVFHSGQRLVLHRSPDYDKKVDWEFRNGFIFNDRPSLSLAFLPLNIHRQTIGVLSVQSYSPNVYDNGLLALLDSIAADLSMALKAAQSTEALKRSEHRLRALFDNMLEGLAYCQIINDDRGQPIDWIYLDVNGAFERLTGISNIIGKRVTEVFPDIRNATPELFEIYGRVASTGNIESFEINFTPLQVWLNITVYSPERGYFVAVFEDISERKRSEKTIRDSESKFRSLFESVQDGIAFVSLEGKIQHSNQAYRDMLGYTEEEIKNLTYMEVTPSRWHEWESRIVKDQIISRGYSDLYEKEYIRKDGTVFPIAVRSALIRDGEGNPIYMVGIVRDITDRKRADETLRKLAAVVEQSAESNDLAETRDRSNMPNRRLR
jgi:PAS domain S-box-containing protein